MQAGFGLWFWRVSDTIHIRWDNTDRLRDGIPVWRELYGETIFPVTEFVAAVGSFDHEFMAAIAQRVEHIKAHWSRPKIKIDLDNLVRQQQERSTWMENALNRKGLGFAWDLYGFTWDEVRAAIAKVEAWVTDT